MRQLLLDHICCFDPHHKFRSKLLKLGFYDDENLVEHPGASMCKFIHLNPKKNVHNYYLEFIHQKNPKKRPMGLSFASDVKLRNLLNKFKKYNVKFFHKNYNWKENSKDILPGWNFITFPDRKNQPLIWITEYEYTKEREIRNNKKSKFKNKNGVNQIIGLCMYLNKKDVKFLSSLLGAPRNNKFMTQNNVFIDYKLSSKTKIKSVICSTPTFNKLALPFKSHETFKYNQQTAYRIKNDVKGQWDLILVKGI